MASTSLKDNSGAAKYIAFFDLDRTITKSISGRELARGAFSRGIMKLPDMIRGIFLSIAFKSGLKSQAEIINELVKWVRGMPEQTLINLCCEISGKVLIPSVYQEAREEIKMHQEKGGKVVILSSALTWICNHIAENLNIDEVICSGLEVSDGLLTGHPIGHLCFGAEKLVRLIEYCEKNSINVSDTWYYADSIADFPALSIVGHPVCINPDRKLRIAAKSANWPVMYWH
jgi:putative phosphoserine phosphatase/1-acylglycerol-3-phosphate O-acyltransferase